MRQHLILACTCPHLVLAALSVPRPLGETGGITHRRAALLRGASAAALALTTSPLRALATEGDASKPRFKSVRPLQFIAALGDPTARSGTGADRWGLWREDPGPQGVYLRDFSSKLEKNNLKAPAGWLFDPSSWWVEEHGLIMPAPSALPARMYERDGAVMKTLATSKRYVVTGDREVTSVLTVHDDGRWELSKGTLYDVTHLPCRSGKYTPATAGGDCSPNAADLKTFPVKPGGLMPAVSGCAKEDWAVLFVVGVEVL